MEHSSTVRFSLDQFTKRKYNRYMYKVISKIGLTLNVCPTLDEAMAFAKTAGMFVTIKGPDFEVCGIFGVDTVKDGLCPDGIAYDWNKASRIGQTKRVRV
jgi:hypothetical protein